MIRERPANSRLMPWSIHHGEECVEIVTRSKEKSMWLPDGLMRLGIQQMSTSKGTKSGCGKTISDRESELWGDLRSSQQIHFRTFVSLVSVMSWRLHQMDVQVTFFSRRSVQSNADYIVSVKVSARVWNVTSRWHRRKISEYIGKCRKTSKKYKNNHVFSIF